MTIDLPPGDELVPDPVVRQELGGISEMTTNRWDRGESRAPEGWPPPVKIGRRNHRPRSLIEQMKANMIAGGHRSSQTRERAQSRFMNWIHSSMPLDVIRRTSPMSRTTRSETCETSSAKLEPSETIPRSRIRVTSPRSILATSDTAGRY